MSDEVELVSDGDGLAVVGERTAVEKYLRSVGLWAASKDLDLRGLKPLLAHGADVARTASEVAANSARWIKLTEESARLVKDQGLMESRTPGVRHLMVGVPGRVHSWLQTEQEPGAASFDPAVLSGIADVMAQTAARQTTAEIAEYLAKIDEKVDDVLRKQDDAAVALMIGAGLAIDSAMSVRATAGGVDEVTWSKVQATESHITYTQSYALLQLKALAEKFEGMTKVRTIAKTAQQAEAEVREWLAVIARCVQLQTEFQGLELDRVLEVSPDKLDDHRRGLRRSRQDQLALVAQATEQLLARIDAAVGLANASMLKTLSRSLAVVEMSNQLAVSVDDFHSVLGIESERRSWEARQLVGVADKGARAIQVVRDKGPVVISAAAALAVAVQVRRGLTDKAEDSG